MKTIEEASYEFSKKVGGDNFTKIQLELAFEAGIEFSQSWIPVEEEIECNINIDGIMYSENVLLKVKDFEFPVVGCYMRANDDEFWEIYGDFKVDQKDITHYRFVELK